MAGKCLQDGTSGVSRLSTVAIEARWAFVTTTLDSLRSTPKSLAPSFDHELAGAIRLTQR